MIPVAVRAAVDDLARRLRARFGGRVQGVRLYGSYARGDADEESDVDVLVLLSDLTWREKCDIAGVAAEVSLGCGFHVSATAMTPEELDRLVGLELAFAQNVVREGVPL